MEYGPVEKCISHQNMVVFPARYVSLPDRMVQNGKKTCENFNCKEAVLCSSLTNNLFLVYVVSTHLNKYARQIGCFSWRIGVKMTNIFELPPPSNPPLPDIMVTIKTTRWKDRLKPRKWTRWRCWVGTAWRVVEDLKNPGFYSRTLVKCGISLWVPLVVIEVEMGWQDFEGFWGAPFPSESVEYIMVRSTK